MGAKARGVGSPILLWMLSHGFAWLFVALWMEAAGQASVGMPRLLGPALPNPQRSAVAAAVAVGCGKHCCGPEAEALQVKV